MTYVCMYVCTHFVHKCKNDVLCIDSRHIYIYMYIYSVYIYLLHVYTTYILQHIKYHQINKCKLIYLQCGSLIHHISIISSTLACKRLCGFLKGLSQIVGTTVDG